MVSGATTTCSPFASLVLSIPIWSRFTHCPLSLLLLASLPQRSFSIRLTWQKCLVQVRAPTDDSAPHKHGQILPVIREVHSNGSAPLCNLRERADRSMRHAVPIFRNSVAPGASMARGRGRLRRASCRERGAVAWPLPRRREHDRRPWPPPRDTRLSCRLRRTRASRQAIGRCGGPYELRGCHLRP